MHFSAVKTDKCPQFHCKANVLHVENRRSLLLLLNMFKLANAPDFCPAVTDSMGTRSHDRINFTIPRPTSDKFLKSYYYKGRSLWNRLPAEDQGLPDSNWFKRRVKPRLLVEEIALYGLPSKTHLTTKILNCSTLH